MDRRDFIQKMLASGLLVSSPPLDLLKDSDRHHLAWLRDSIGIFLYNDYIRGFKYYEGVSLLAQLKPEDELELVREYDNPHDDYAIAVYWEGHKLGFLPSQKNEVIANLLDHGVLLESRIVYTQPEAAPWEMCFIGVWVLMPSTPAFMQYLEWFENSPDAGFRKRKEYGGEGNLDKKEDKDPINFGEEKEEWEDYPYFMGNDEESV